MELIGRARSFATRAHQGQTRANKARTPMSSHFETVASLVAESGGSDIEVAAALLHDVVEDTDFTIDDIIIEFGSVVGEVVYGLTDLPEFGRLDTAERKAAQARRVGAENNNVKRIKLADQIANVFDVAVDPPVHWDKRKCLEYVRGAKLIADKCRGISLMPDVYFEEVYKLALIKHYSTETTG